ncbi:aspartic peptidase A1 [Pilatotrama ljubarskyi]|nr:aspartic peptidase A1 [Pilatotrama ljubarskyi]
MRAPSLVTLLITFLVSAAASPLPPFSASSLSLSDPVARLSSYSPSSSITLPLARRFNGTGSANVLKFDQARAKATRSRPRGDGGSSDMNAGTVASDGVFNAAAASEVVSYVVTVLLGEARTPYNLLVDTGSSNTWVGAKEPFVPSSSTHYTGDLVSVHYGSGSFNGFEITDTITLGNGLTLKNQSIGVAIHSSGFDGVDGILGIGPQDLTRGSLFFESDKIIPTVTDNAWYAGLIDEYEVGISFHPDSPYNGQANGEVTFGGIDSSKFDGALQYVPLTTTSPASAFVGIEQSVRYGEKNSILEHTAGILDTGTTLILIATDAFNRYQKYTGGVLDKDTGLLCITKEQYGNLKTLNFKIGHQEYALTPNAQIWPRALNKDIGGTDDGIYLIVNDLQSETGKGLDFINGMTFLQRFYAVYDIGNSRVGLARTPYTDDDSN